MQSIPSKLLCSKQIARPSDDNTSSSGMNKVATLNQQAPSFFQRLPSNEAERKHLLQWIICRHNTSCCDSTNKIHLEQQPTSITKHKPANKLTKWIDATFSDLSADSMYLITFALGCFAMYHNTSFKPMVTSSANKLFIAYWFQLYGTEVCSKALTDLSHLMNETKEDLPFALDIEKFCSRVTPESIKEAAFAPISGSSSLNRDILSCYYASSAVFPQLVFRDDIVSSALSSFGFTMQDIWDYKARYNGYFQIIMAGIDHFIKSGKAPDSSLVQELEKCFKSWSSYGQPKVIESFQQALEIIEKMQTDEAVRASVQSMEPPGSSSMTAPPPTPDEEEDTLDLC